MTFGMVAGTNAAETIAGSELCCLAFHRRNRFICQSLGNDLNDVRRRRSWILWMIFEHLVWKVRKEPGVATRNLQSLAMILSVKIQGMCVCACVHVCVCVFDI